MESKKTLPSKILATDIDAAAVQAASQNAKTAGVDHLIEFVTCSFEETSIPGGGGIIMMNPPYGERMEPLKIKMLRPDRKKEIAPGQKVILRKAADHGS